MNTKAQGPESVAAAPFRLPTGGLVDRAAALPFSLDGRMLTGLAGDTLASAMLAAGHRTVGRSFKYHRPRGVLTAGSEEPNALVELRTGARREPNTKATTVELYAGLEATTQNRWPSLRFDLLRLNSLLAPLIPAGFYYKTFMWPAAFWERVYEPLIRRAAGLGRGAAAADPDHYEHANAFCDLLVIGSGPAGISAALAAARAGARVILCEEDFRFGGRLLADACEIDGVPGFAWASAAEAELEGCGDVKLMPRTAVFGCYDGGIYGAVERIADHVPVPPPHQPRQRLWRIVARRAVLAAGAVERGIAFAGNDAPGIMMAAAMRTYIGRFAVVPGHRVTIFTASHDGWSTARKLQSCGIDVAAVVDPRPDVPQTLTRGIDARIILEGAVVAAAGTPLRAVTVRSRSGVLEIACDAAAVSGGFNPNLGLACHHGTRPAWSEEVAAFVPAGLPPGMRVAGAANGTMTLARCLAEGEAAGCAAAEELGFKLPSRDPARADDESFAVSPFWYVEGAAHKAFVDFQNDVTAADIALAAREGFRTAEHLKRYTTLGMATEQGRTSNVIGLAMMASLSARTIPEVGTTSHRAPAVPVAIAAFAGPHRGKRFRPVRRTPSHQWALRQGAVFVETGAWLRAQYFPRIGERDWLETVSREVRTVRSSVGFCDVSTLGKIEVMGPDAGMFLDRLYVNTFSTLPVGRARYGLMLREDGFVLDDGTVSRLADDRFFMTTTTVNAALVFQHMQFCRQVLWPELDVQFMSATDQWAQFSLAGPQARRVLEPLIDPPFDICKEAFPHMAVGELTICGGVRARLYRLSFSGELAYEVGVPARFGEATVRALMEVGAPYGIAPYGTEALGVMRIEKGHVAGNEIDGRTTAGDLGLSRMVSRKKDFIGRVLAERPALQDGSRMALAGFRPVDRTQRLRAGAHLVPRGAEVSAANDQGVLTSVAYSPSLDHWIGLGLITRGPERIGERVRAFDPVRNGDVEVELCPPCFLDPQGERLHG